MATTLAIAAGHLGAHRDRTSLFLSYRQSYAHHPTNRTQPGALGSYRDDGDSEHAGLMQNADSGDAVIEMDVLHPRWLDVEDRVKDLLAGIAVTIKQLDKLHAKHVLPGFNDEAIKSTEEREIEDLTQDVTRQFGACQGAIKSIERVIKQEQQSSRGGPSRSEVDMARNLQMALAARVGEASTTFRKKQTAYLKKLRALGGLSLPEERSAASGNPYTDPAMMDEEADRASAQTTLQQQAQVRRRAGLGDATIAQREREIETIAQGVIDLSNIFQELNSMVIDQGSLLDRIDYNVERTSEHMQAAEKELSVATGYQKKSTKRKIILLLILIVVGMFILLMLKPRSKGNGGSGSAPINPPAVIPGELPPDRFEKIPESPPGRIRDGESKRRRAEWKQRRRRQL